MMTFLYDIELLAPPGMTPLRTKKDKRQSVKTGESTIVCVPGSNYAQHSQRESKMCKVSKLMHLRKILIDLLK